MLKVKCLAVIKSSASGHDPKKKNSRAFWLAAKIVLQPIRMVKLRLASIHAECAGPAWHLHFRDFQHTIINNTNFNDFLTNNSINNCVFCFLHSIFSESWAQMLCLRRKRIVVTKDRPHGPGHSIPMFKSWVWRPLGYPSAQNSVLSNVFVHGSDRTPPHTAIWCTYQPLVLVLPTKLLTYKFYDICPKGFLANTIFRTRKPA